MIWKALFRRTREGADARAMRDAIYRAQALLHKLPAAPDSH